MSQAALRGASLGMRPYFREIAATPLLTFAGERELALRIADGDAEARDQLVRANLRLVVCIAQRFLHRGLDLDDLVAEGNLGLIRATETFDPAVGVRFATYAALWIKQSISRHIRERGRFVRLPHYVVNLLAKWKRTSANLARQLGREPSHEEVGEALGLSPKKLRIACEAIQAEHLVRHREETSGEKEGLPPYFFLADPRNEAAVDVLSREEEVSAVLAGVDRLEERDATILRLRYGLGSVKPLTLKVIGEQLGLTRERVRQLEQKALATVGAAVG
jgi:RNA polymerase primary sigma factor